MRVLHVIPSLEKRDGGTTVALQLMARGLSLQGTHVEVATTHDPGMAANPTQSSVSGLPSGEPIVRFFKRQTGFYKVSWPLRTWLRQHIQEYDLVHLHALFSFSTAIAARCARHHRRPYVVSPHGMLNTWGMQNRRRLVKWLSFRCIEKPILRHAAMLHYTSHAEQAEAERCGVTSPAVVIPLGIDITRPAPLPSPKAFLQKFPVIGGRRIILFLSRIDPKKGLDVLLPAFARVHSMVPDSLLVLAGEGDGAYLDSLRRRAKDLSIENNVLWAGFLEGEEKSSAYAATTVFVLPSYSENFGLALVEALAAGLPCVTTEGVAVSRDVLEFDAGVVAPCEVAGLADALEKLMGDPATRLRLGANAHRLANDRYSLPAMGRSLKEWYEGILAKEKAA